MSWLLWADLDKYSERAIFYMRFDRTTCKKNVETVFLVCIEGKLSVNCFSAIMHDLCFVCV